MTRTPATPDLDVTAPAGAGAGDSQAGEVQGGVNAAWLFAPGQLLAGRYRVRAFIARGGMGEVYEAEDEELGVAIALKALLPAGDPVEREARLARELVMARRVTHPAVCRAFDVAHERIAGGRFTVPFVTMELLRGETLAAHLAGVGPMPLEQVTPIVEQLAAGLDAAHAAGIVHRDFKPANVILAGSRVVITDFGLARAIVPGSSGGGASTADFAGTPAYMAPEQVLDEQVSAATDVYSLGLTLFEMVTGTRPFEAQSPLALAMARVRSDPPRASTRMPGLDARWDAAIARCLTRDPAHRFARAGDVVAALRADVPVAITAPRRRSQRGSRRRTVVAAALAACTVAIAAVVFVLVRGDDARRPSSTIAPGVFERFPQGETAMLGNLGSELDGIIRQIVVAPDGDIFVAGDTRGSMAPDGKRLVLPIGNEVAFVARFSPIGRLRWIQTAIEDGESVQGHGLALVGDVVAFVGSHQRGVRIGSSTFDTDSAGCFVAALAAADGAPRWLASCDDHVALGTAVTTDGRAIFVAASAGTGTIIEDPGRGGRLVVSAYTIGGERVWHVESDTGGWLGGVDVATRAGRLVVSTSVRGRLQLEGVALDARGESDLVVASFDVASGAMHWARALGGPGHDGANDVAILRDGRIAVVGSFEGEIEVIPGQPKRAAGARDALVALLSADGTPESAWTVGGPGRDVWTAVVVEGDYLVLVGEADPGFAFDGATPLDAHRIVVARAALDGTRASQTTYGMVETYVSDVALAANDDVLVTGSFVRRLAIGQAVRRVAANDGYVVQLRPPWRPLP